MSKRRHTTDSRVENIKQAKKVQLTPSRPTLRGPIVNWPDKDFGRVLATRSSMCDGLLRIGCPLVDNCPDVRAVDFSGCLSDTRRTRVSFRQYSDDFEFAVMTLYMMDPDPKDTASGDDPMDYNYMLALVDGAFYSRAGEQLLVAIDKTALLAKDVIIICDRFSFKLYDDNSKDNSIVMAQCRPSINDVRKYIASDKTGHVMTMKTQFNFNNPFIQMRIIDEGGFPDNYFWTNTHVI